MCWRQARQPQKRARAEISSPSFSLQRERDVTWLMMMIDCMAGQEGRKEGWKEGGEERKEGRKEGRVEGRRRGEEGVLSVCVAQSLVFRLLPPHCVRAKSRLIPDSEPLMFPS